MPVVPREPITSLMRRICAGDWVRFVGQSASVRGLGKVIDGDYDPADSSLRAARVEFARLALWVLPGDLRRIGPEEEMRLVEEAVEHVLMPESAANRIREALRDPERLNFVRSPGFLDLLWSLMGSLPGERAVNGLARFFDEGEISWKPAPAPRPVAPPVSPAPTPAPAFTPIQEEPVARPRSLPSLPRGTVRNRALMTLDEDTLRRVAWRGGLVLENASPYSVHKKVLESDVGLEAILIPLADWQLVAVARALQLDFSGHSSEITARILALAANEHDVPPPVAALPPKPAAPGTMLERVLATLNHTVLNELAARKVLAVAKSDSAHVVREKLVDSGIALAEVLDALTDNQLAHAGRVADVEPSADPLTLRARILLREWREKPSVPLPAESRPDLPVLSPGTTFAGVVATLDRDALLMVGTLKGISFEKDEPVESVRAKIYTSKIDLQTVLAALTDMQLAGAARVLGIEPSARDEAGWKKRSELKANILALAANERPAPSPTLSQPTTAPPPTPMPAQLDPKLILERFDIDTIFALALAHPAPPGVPTGSPSDLRSYLATSGLDLAKLVHGLTLQQLQRAARNSGLPVEGTADELATRILGGAPSPRLVDHPTDW